MGVVLLVAGAALAGWGAREASRAERPRDLVGAMAAGAGVLVALLGAAAVSVPGFLTLH